MTPRRRAVALCRSGTSGGEVQRFVDRYGLELVYTVITDSDSAKLTTMIAAQHLFDYGAEVLVVPFMTRAQVEAEERWKVLTVAADIVTGDGLVGYAPLR